MSEYICYICRRTITPKRAKLTGPFETREEFMREVQRLRLKKGMMVIEIAKQFGVSPTTISRLVHGDVKQE